jgi:signal transduction histidine kinase
MTKKKLSYYNYFLVLALVLISGYYMTSLFFLNKTNYSGEQADLYGEITENADAILKSAYRMEAYAYGYLLTHNQDTYQKYKSKICSFKQQFIDLKDHCLENELATEHVAKLHELINERMEHIQHLVSHDSVSPMSNKERIQMLESGSLLMDEINEVLYDIRTVSAERKSINKERASASAENTTTLLTIFGLFMLFIVYFSFIKMRREIHKNEKNTEEIAQFNIELKSMNENLESFAYVASHDLNEPLRKIRTFGDLIGEEMRKDQPDPRTIMDHIERMQSSAERMQQLIKDLLAYSRISRQNETFESVNIQQIIEEVMVDLKLRLEDTEAQVKLGDLPTTMRANASQMRQLFQNLLSNALKFKKDHVAPVITISSDVVEGKEVHDPHVALLTEKKYWRITFADNGIGFSNAYAEKIFMIFQRLHGRSEYEGTGIGLSICKKICEQHKGDISAFGEEGEGSQFIIYIPKV